MRYGWKNAVQTVCGILLSDILLIVAVVWGYSFFVDMTAGAEVWLQAISAVLLVCFGSTLITAAWSRAKPDPAPRQGRSDCFWLGFTITFFDPKAFAFYFGVLPSLFDLKSFGIIQVGYLTCLVIVIVVITKLFYSWIALRGWKSLRDDSQRRYALSLSGITLVCIGFKAILT